MDSVGFYDRNDDDQPFEIVSFYGSTKYLNVIAKDIMYSRKTEVSNVRSVLFTSVTLELYVNFFLQCFMEQTSSAVVK